MVAHPELMPWGRRSRLCLFPNRRLVGIGGNCACLVPVRLGDHFGTVAPERVNREMRCFNDVHEQRASRQQI